MECATCGNDHPENYCPSCGEKPFEPKQLSFKEFIEELFEGFLHFDNKFFRTLKQLVTKPGQLSLDYTHGRRVWYMKPIQLFLVMNLIFFILAFHNMYSLPLNNYITYNPFIRFNTQHIIKQELANSHLSLKEYTQVFNEKIKGLSKECIFLFIPFYGLAFYAFFFKKKQYFVEHLVFATHFCTFILLLTLAAFYFITIPYYSISGDDYSPTFDGISSLFTEVCIAIYAGIAIKRFYNPHLIYTIIIALATGYSFFTVIQYYRMLLFFKIVYFH
jgi:hypothetical protein